MDARSGPSGWSWPENMATASTGSDARPQPMPRAHAATEPAFAQPQDSEPTHSNPEPETAPPQPQRHRRYRPRQCRICLDVVEPTYETATSTAAAFLGQQPKVRFVSDDPELGRLLSPCKCKGSQKYVHEGCLQAWRQAQPLSERNFWKCPTCGFEYRMERLRWGRWVSSRLTRLAITVTILVVTVFLLGFVADPIIDMWFDPMGTIVSTVADRGDEFDAPLRFHDENEPSTWFEHFLGGFFSLGLMGFVKSILAASPWYWWNMRNAMGGGRQRRGGGRDRMEGINFVLVLVGVFTFLAAVWKFIGYVSGRFLEKVSERVVDVQHDDDDEEEDDEDVPAAATGPGDGT